MGSSCLYPPEITLQFAFSSSSIASPYPSPFPLGSGCSHEVFSHWVIWSLFVTTANSSRQKILRCHSLSSLDINKTIAVHIINHHKCMPGITKGHGVHVIVELKQETWKSKNVRHGDDERGQGPSVGCGNKQQSAWISRKERKMLHSDTLSVDSRQISIFKE